MRKRIIINTRLLITGYWTMRSKKGRCSGTRESGMSLSGDDRTKHAQSHPHPTSATTNDANTTICINSPPTMIIASFTCYGTSIGKILISGFGLGLPEVLVRDIRYVLSKTRCLIRVGVGRSDGRHKANPSFHAITKISRILGISAMLMMGINKSIKEAQYHDSISKAL